MNSWFNYLLMTSPGGEQNPYSSLVFLALIIVVFYFFMIRPQVKKQKELTNYRKNLAKGDKVITNGGIYGKIIEVKEKYLVIDAGSDVKLKVDKNSVVQDSGDLEQKK